MERGRRSLEAVVRRARRAARDERGQTPTEYLMIVGLMAAVIIVVFMMFYWQNVRTVAQTWLTNVRQAVSGSGVTP
jgi:Flp pilus assembly pilin Flp